MKIIKYFIYDKDLIALSLCLIISNILFFYGTSKQVSVIKSHLTDAIYVITYPQKWYKQMLSTKEENKILINQNIQLKLLNNTLLNTKFENDKLRNLLEFKNESPWTLVPANVTRSVTETVKSIIVDVGDDALIRKHLSVIDINGLVGKTHAIGNFATQVQLITDKNFRVSIRVGAEYALGNFMPTIGKNGILQGVRKSVIINPGDIAYTSGISDIYPKGIPVASVVSVEDNPNKAFKHIIVEVLAELNNLDYVYVIQ